jgi:glycosyltransferase involved in cell wall biosynthesis
MNSLLIISSVHHFTDGVNYFGYGPYVREMNIWIENEEEVWIFAPLIKGKSPGKIDLSYVHPNIKFFPVLAFNIQSISNFLKSCYQVPLILWKMIKLMKKAAHIHIRIPGNMGLLALLTQFFFPAKRKIIKYAGNWDPSSRQPFSYRIQRKISNSKIFTSKASVLVYGEWPDNKAHVIPFFTASYWEREKVMVTKSPISELLKLVFVGTICDSKNPIIGLQLAKLLKESSIKFSFKYCGDGVLKNDMEKISMEWGLNDEVQFLGNIDSEEVKRTLQESHFLIFVSDSEGWPKAVAESMFWGCVPITSAVSCVPQILGVDERGLLVPKDPYVIFNEIIKFISQPLKFNQMSKKAMDWSRSYTLDRFQSEIKKIIK